MSPACSGCPYEGDIAPMAVANVAKALSDMGCYEISLGDTIGIGSAEGRPRTDRNGRAGVQKSETLAGHFHDTYGMAAANVFAALEMGAGDVRFLGRRPRRLPLRQGASGNVATEDLVWLMDGLESRPASIWTPWSIARCGSAAFSAARRASK